MGKSPGKKAVIEGLKARREKVQNEVNQTQSDKSHIRQCIQAKAEDLFRSAMTKNALEILATKPSPVMRAVRELLSRMADEIGMIWQRHSVLQQKSLSEVARLTAELGSNYSGSEVAKSMLPG